MIDIRQRLTDIKNLPSTLGVVKASDVGLLVDQLLCDIDIDAAVDRNDFLEVARLENSRPA